MELVRLNRGSERRAQGWMIWINLAEERRSNDCLSKIFLVQIPQQPEVSIVRFDPAPQGFVTV